MCIRLSYVTQQRRKQFCLAAVRKRTRFSRLKELTLLVEPFIFTARRYASAVLAVIVCLSVCLSVRPSVRPSQVEVVQRWLNLGSH